MNGRSEKMFTERHATPKELADPGIRKGRPQKLKSSHAEETVSSTDIAEFRSDLKINNLEGVGCALDMVPERWDGPHVGLRLQHAFETLRAQPAVLGPREFGTIWPVYLDEWADLMRRIDAEQVDLPPVKMRPTVAQVTRMETAISWPAHYLGHRFHQFMLAVQRVALAKAMGRDVEWVAKRFGLEAETWQLRNWAGCDRIANGLIADRVAVF